LFNGQWLSALVSSPFPLRFILANSTPGHPIVLDTIRRIHLKTKQADEILGGSLQAIPDDYIADSVLEWTGAFLIIGTVGDGLLTVND